MPIQYVVTKIKNSCNSDTLE